MMNAPSWAGNKIGLNSLLPDFGFVNSGVLKSDRVSDKEDKIRHDYCADTMHIFLFLPAGNNSKANVSFRNESVQF